jgi:hypothetical protein
MFPFLCTDPYVRSRAITCGYGLPYHPRHPVVAVQYIAGCFWHAAVVVAHHGAVVTIVDLTQLRSLQVEHDRVQSEIASLRSAASMNESADKLAGDNMSLREQVNKPLPCTAPLNLSTSKCPPTHLDVLPTRCCCLFFVKYHCSHCTHIS